MKCLALVACLCIVTLFSPSEALPEPRQLGLKKKGPNDNPFFPDYPHLDAGLPHTYPMPMPSPPADPPVPHEPPPHGGEPTPPKYVKDEVVVTTEAQFTCSEGFVMQDDKCLQFEQKKSKLGCREGWKFERGVCVGLEVEPGGSTCDAGFELSNGVCSKTVEAPNQIFCPDGFEIGDEHCVREVHTSAQEHCPDDFTLVGDECYRKTSVSPTAECSSGYVLKHGMCRHSSAVPSEPRCRGGFSLDYKGRCIREEEGPAITACPTGYQVEGHKCVKRETVPAVTNCPEGSRLNGMECVLSHSVVPEPSCPEGYYIDNAKGPLLCVKQIVQPMEPYCHKGFFNPTTGTCGSKKHAEEAEYRCPAGFTGKDKGECIKLDKVKTQMLCPPQFELNHMFKTCESFSKVEPEFLCPHKGYSLVPGTASCSLTDYASVKKGCPPRYHFNPDTDSCITQIREEPGVNCPPGYSPSVEGQCVKIEALKPEATCVPGFVLQSDGYKKVCVQEQRLPLSYSCPPEYQLKEEKRGGHLGKTAHNTCVGLEHAEPEIVCPSGFVRDLNSRCTRVEQADMRTTCSRDFQIRNGQCVKVLEEEPVVMCPVGFKLYNGVCVNQLVAKPKAVCPSGYKFDALVRQCYRVKVKYNFQEPVPAEEILDDETPREPSEDVLDDEQEPQPQAQMMAPQVMPQNIQIIQQPIPIPAPVVYLPRQGTAVMPPPAPYPAPYPVPVPYPVEKKVEIEKPVPFAVKVPVPQGHKDKKFRHFM